MVNLLFNPKKVANAKRVLADADLKKWQLAAIVESSDDAIIGLRLDGTVVSWNKTAEHTYGYSESEIVGQPVSILSPANRPIEIPRILEKISEGEHIKHYETTRVRTDGS